MTPPAVRRAPARKKEGLWRRRAETTSRCLTRPDPMGDLSVKSVPEGDSVFPAVRPAPRGSEFLSADARQRGAGVNVERPQRSEDERP